MAEREEKPVAQACGCIDDYVSGLPIKRCPTHTPRAQRVAAELQKLGEALDRAASAIHDPSVGNAARAAVNAGKAVMS